MRVLSLFSGVGGLDLGLERAGMTTVAQVEFDPVPQSVLQRHWPDVPKWGDVAAVHGDELPDCDLIAFGSPCQDLSVAGNRAGLDGERSGLFHHAIRLIKELQDDGRGPTWVVFENVAGALQSNAGNDWSVVLDSLGERGALVLEYRVLDSQFFGSPQRRRRVFLCASFVAGTEHQPEILALPESVRRDSAKGERQGGRAAGIASHHVGTDSDLYSFDVKFGKSANVFINQTPPAKIAGGGATVAVCGADIAPRRLTPLEVERLMTWPDEWTRWAADGTELTDVERYKACGNGVVSNVAQWVGERIVLTDRNMKDA
jgi:DNA (cytosine-5)-methyltransferase 1